MKAKCHFKFNVLVKSFLIKVYCVWVKFQAIFMTPYWFIKAGLTSKTRHFYNELSPGVIESIQQHSKMDFQRDIGEQRKTFLFALIYHRKKAKLLYKMAAIFWQLDTHGRSQYTINIIASHFYWSRRKPTNIWNQNESNLKRNTNVLPFLICWVFRTPLINGWLSVIQVIGIDNRID